MHQRYKHSFFLQNTGLLMFIALVLGKSQVLIVHYLFEANCVDLPFDMY